VLDDRAGAVVTYDAQRRPDRIVGDAGELQEPVAIGLHDGTLYVADAERRAVFRYGRFGTFQERLPLPDLPAPRALTVHRGRLWVVCADRIVVWDPDTETRRVHRVPLPGPLVGAVGWKGTLFALTDRQLVRLPGWE
jgi:sugar lactone lactonase YvrE